MGNARWRKVTILRAGRVSRDERDGAPDAISNTLRPTRGMAIPHCAVIARLLGERAMTAPGGWGQNASRATGFSMGISGNSLLLPRFSRLSPLLCGRSARDHRASTHGSNKGDFCIMPGHPINVPEIFAAATVATPRTRSILSRCRQRSSLLCLRIVVRMIAILRRSDGGPSPTPLPASIQHDIGVSQMILPHRRFSCPSLTGRRHASQLRNASIASICWRTDRCQTVLQSSFFSMAFDDTAAVMP